MWWRKSQQPRPRRPFSPPSRRSIRNVVGLSLALAVLSFSTVFNYIQRARLFATDGVEDQSIVITGTGTATRWFKVQGDVTEVRRLSQWMLGGVTYKIVRPLIPLQSIVVSEPTTDDFSTMTMDRSLRHLSIGRQPTRKPLYSPPLKPHERPLLVETRLDDHLASLSQLTRLEDLRLHDISLDGRGLSALTGLSNLRRFALTIHPDAEPPNIEVVYRHLERMQSVEWLELDGVLLHAGHIGRLNSLPHLHTLCVAIAGDGDEERINRLQFASLSQLKHVTRVLIRQNTRNPMPRRLYALPIPNAVLDAVARIPSLQSLSVEYAPATAEGLKRLARSKTLETLQLLGQTMTADDALIICQFPSLKRLEWSEQPDDDALGVLDGQRRISCGRASSNSPSQTEQISSWP